MHPRGPAQGEFVDRGDGWYADPAPDHLPVDDPLDILEQTQIRLMGEHTVDVPLWSDEAGLIFSTADQLVAEWHVSRDLADELVAWGRAWQASSGEPEHDAEAARLVRRLKEELRDRFRFVYHP